MSSDRRADNGELCAWKRKREEKSYGVRRKSDVVSENCKQKDFFFCRYLLKVRAIMFVCLCVHNLGVQVFSGTTPSLHERRGKKVLAAAEKTKRLYIYIYYRSKDSCASFTSETVGSLAFRWNRQNVPIVMDTLLGYKRRRREARFSERHFQRNQTTNDAISSSTGISLGSASVLCFSFFFFPSEFLCESHSWKKNSYHQLWSLQPSLYV